MQNANTDHVFQNATSFKTQSTKRNQNETHSERNTSKTKRVKPKRMKRNRGSLVNTSLPDFWQHRDRDTTLTIAFIVLSHLDLHFHRRAL